MTPRTWALSLVVSSLLAGIATPALADRDKHSDKQGRGHDRYEERYNSRDRDRNRDRDYYERRDNSRHRDTVYVPAFRSRDRDIIVHYYDRSGWRCPRGLAKKHNGCYPPGFSKKRYVIGQPLPRYVVIEPLPRDLIYSLPPPPAGYYYRRVDGDILLIAEATKHVIDAITLFSAVR